jgi:aldehyde dehydrogenase (NAD+)
MNSMPSTQGGASAPRADRGVTELSIPKLVSGVRTTFDAGRSRSLAWRQKQLAGLRRFIREREREILGALHADVGKSALEGYSTELGFTLSDIDYIDKRLPGWLKPERVSVPLISQPGSARVYREPLGVVLIISPWNYPFQLLIDPLVGALAAGNCAILKPSEVSPATSAVIARWLPEYVDHEAVKVVEGGVAETTALLAEQFDHIFYTGNGTVGRVVMAAAVKHLTPVTLELGGKSPCYVDRDADLEVAARRIAWGKFTNAGQTCVAPDYILAHAAIHDRLLDLLGSTIKSFYGGDPKHSADYGRIVNARHHQRLMKLMGSGRIVVGGEADEAARYIAPTVLRDVSPDSPVMCDEIFGPILPVLSVSGPDEAVRFVNARPKPLALYVFSSSEATQERILGATSAGGVSINHTLFHLAVHGLPFGGVGESGMGAYHGRLSFETFTHRKAVLRKPTSIDPSLLYPPYDETKTKWIRRLM